MVLFKGTQKQLGGSDKLLFAALWTAAQLITLEWCASK